MTRLHRDAFGTGLTTWQLLEQLDWAAERLERVFDAGPVNDVERQRIAGAAASIVRRLSTVAGSAEPVAGRSSTPAPGRSPQATEDQLEALDELASTLAVRPGAGDLGHEVTAALSIATSMVRWARRLAYAEAGVSMRPEHTRARRAARTGR